MINVYLCIIKIHKKVIIYIIKCYLNKRNTHVRDTNTY